MGAHPVGFEGESSKGRFPPRGVGVFGRVGIGDDGAISVGALGGDGRGKDIVASLDGQVVRGAGKGGE